MIGKCEICGESHPLKRDTHQGKFLGMLCKGCLRFMRLVDHDQSRIRRLLDYKHPGWDDTTLAE